MKSISIALLLVLVFQSHSAFAYTTPDGDGRDCGYLQTCCDDFKCNIVLTYIEGTMGALFMVATFLAAIFTFVLAFVSRRKKDVTIAFIFLSASLGTFVFRSFIPTTFKPVIYLYPAKPQQVDVSLNYHGKLTVTYPSYDEGIKGWKVLAHPDGKIINSKDQKEYSYIFWEGILPGGIYKMPSEGFIVPGNESAEFLQDLLAKAGLTPREYNELIVFWYPQIKDFPFVQIAFAGPEYEQTAELRINPKPDSIQRIFLYFRKLSSSRELKPQEVPKFERKGFAVVEWGGTILP